MSRCRVSSLSSKRSTPRAQPVKLAGFNSGALLDGAAETWAGCAECEDAAASLAPPLSRCIDVEATPLGGLFAGYEDPLINRAYAA